jgi:hypothetical protein
MARSIAPGNLPPDHGFAARSDRIAGRRIRAVAAEGSQRGFPVRHEQVKFRGALDRRRSSQTRRGSCSARVGLSDVVGGSFSLETCCRPFRSE